MNIENTLGEPPSIEGVTAMQPGQPPKNPSGVYPAPAEERYPDKKIGVLPKNTSWTTGIGTHYDPKDATQTKANPDGIGAYGRKIENGSVALGNRSLPGATWEELKQGKEVYIKVKELEDVETPHGMGVFRIDDTMNKRYANENKIDFFMGDMSEELKRKGKFGIHFTII